MGEGLHELKAGAWVLLLPLWLPKLQMAVRDSPFARLVTE